MLNDVKTVQSLLKSGKTREEIAKLLNISLWNARQLIMQAKGLMSAEISEDAVKSDLRASKLQREKNDIEAKYKDVLNELNQAKEYQQGIKELSEFVQKSKPSKFVVKNDGKQSVSTAFMVASDWHAEETVIRSHINGLNEYNLEIAKQRAKNFFVNGLKLVEMCRSKSRIDTLVLALLGDFITGYIHDELLESNSLSPTQASLMVYELIVSGVDFLVANGDFKNIVVPTCQGNHGRCHDEKTELLTIDGWKKYNELRIGQLVATYNMHTKETEWQPLQDVYIDNYIGPMVAIKTTTFDFMVTPHHRMVVSNHTKVDEFIEIQEFVKNGSFGAYDWPNCSLGHNKEYNLISDDELRLLALIMTDGSYSGGNINIYQSKENGKQKTTELLDRMNINYDIIDRHRTGQIIRGKEVENSLPETTYCIHKKHYAKIKELLPDCKTIPDWAKKLSNRQVNVFLDTMIETDESVHGINRVLYKDINFLEQVQALAVTNGISARLRTDNRGDYVLSLPTTTRGWINSFDDAVDVCPYNGIIWCGTVANGTLITRRNGIPLVSGNTTQKPRISTYADNSFEWLLYSFLLKHYVNHPIVSIKLTDGYFNNIEVYDRLVRFHHGDSVRYAGGVGGLHIPLRKAIAQWNKARQAYLDVLGHWHSRTSSQDYLVNGSLIGYNDFAIKIKADYEVPQQSFFLMHPKYGKTVEAPIFVE